MNNIEFHFEDISIPDFNPEFFRLWISKVLELHKVDAQELSFIFCSDEYILDINKQYLNHNYFTDIITFNYNTDEYIAGDIFVSYHTVISNSDVYSKGSVQDELERVVIHGVLHLIGFNDKTNSEQVEMTNQEDIALKLRKNVSRETKKR